MKIKNYLILLFIILLCIWFLIPQYITPPGHFDYLYLKYEKQYTDVSAYTSVCDNTKIMMVGIKYKKLGNEKKCINWIKKRDFCISLHSEYKGIVFQDVSEICIKKEEK